MNIIGTKLSALLGKKFWPSAIAAGILCAGLLSVGCESPSATPIADEVNRSVSDFTVGQTETPSATFSTIGQTETPTATILVNAVNRSVSDSTVGQTKTPTATVASDTNSRWKNLVNELCSAARAHHEWPSPANESELSQAYADLRYEDANGQLFAEYQQMRLNGLCGPTAVPPTPTPTPQEITFVYNTQNPDPSAWENLVFSDTSGAIWRVAGVDEYGLWLSGSGQEHQLWLEMVSETGETISMNGAILDSNFPGQAEFFFGDAEMNIFNVSETWTITIGSEPGK